MEKFTFLEPETMLPAPGFIQSPFESVSTHGLVKRLLERPPSASCWCPAGTSQGMYAYPAQPDPALVYTWLQSLTL